MTSGVGLAERLERYREIESERERPLIVYATSPRQAAGGSIASDVIPEFLDQLATLPRSCQAVDVLIASNGGDPNTAWRIVSLIRERVEKLGVLIPQAAFSAATLIALGADEILMHPNGNLGPVDPQIQVQKERRRAQGGPPEIEQMRFGYEELTGFLAYARQELGITDQEHLRALFEKFCDAVGPVSLGIAARSSRLSLSLGQKLLQMHMKSGQEAEKAKAIAGKLNKDFFSHGYPMGRKEARELGLTIPELAPEFEDRMWELWCDLEQEFKGREAFDPLAEVAKSREHAAVLFAGAPQVSIPANLPPQLMEAVLRTIVQNVGTITQLAPLDFETQQAVVESVRKASHFVTRGKILATRLPDLNVVTTIAPTETGWQNRILP